MARSARGTAKCVRRASRVLLPVALWASPGGLSAAEAPEIGTGQSSSTSNSKAGSVEIVWEAPRECPDLASVQRHAERLLGQPLEAPRAQRVQARARVRRNELGNWQLSLSLSSNDRISEETLIAKRCSTLADATALKVALATDPVATVAALETAPAPEVPLATEPPSAEPSARAWNPEPTLEAVNALNFRLVTGLGMGQLNGVAPALGFALSLERAAVRVELGGQGFWGADARYESLPEVGAHLQLFSALARGCSVPHVGSLQFPLCLGAELGFLRGDGFGVDAARSASSPWAAVVFGPALRAPLGRVVSFWIEAAAVVPFLKPRLNVRNLGDLYTAPSAAARLWAGCEIRLNP